MKDLFLKNEIKAGGVKQVCMHCGVKRLAMEFCALATIIDEAIFEHFQPSVDGEGQSFDQLIVDHAGIDPAIADSIRSWFSQSRGYRAAKDGDENLYGDTVGFVESGVSSTRYREGWRAFQRGLREDARYFNRIAQTFLDDIFADVPTLTNMHGELLIATWGPRQVPLMRGRVAKNDVELELFLSNPAAELGSPPPGVATLGRMNAAGVSVFYGAFDMETCRAEIRPPAGSHVLFASFDIVRPLRILNLEALAYAQFDGSIFNRAYGRRIERAAFLRRFDEEISQPVMPGDEIFGYLATQAVADYLAQVLGLDGITFRSTQAGRNRTMSGHPRQNIVLFSHAARVEPVDTSGLKTDLRVGSLVEEQDSSLSITDYVLPKPRKRRKKLEESVFDILIAPPENDRNLDTRLPTLRYVPDSVSVQYVWGTDYDTTSRRLSRSRLSRADVAKWEF